MERVAQVMHHVRPEECAVPLSTAAETKKQQRAFPTRRQEALKWNGWGYNDSAFELNEKGLVWLSGSRYSLSGQEMPNLRKWMEDKCGVNMEDHSPSQDYLSDIPAPIRNETFTRAVEKRVKFISFDNEDRVMHAHGHTCHEIMALRHGSFKRIPDVVIWPGSSEQVELVVKAAADFDVCIIPFGGGTSVSHALLCPEDETRMIVSLDMTEMDRIVWIDRESMTARIEAGIIGQDLERRLAAEGLCTGHEPDSMEFSSLGGWISTRASGMKKNIYGNIEDILVHVKLVTPTGVLEKSCQVPRISTGPDVHQIVLGSEGILGVITEATLRVRPLPECKLYGSLVFPSFEMGVACMREVALQRCAPASIRLIDNDQFQFSQALKPHPASAFHALVDMAKKFYVTRLKGFVPEKMVAATLLFEGSKTDVDEQQRKIYAIASRYGGLAGGEENGLRGYFLTFVIAYLRDIGFNYHFIAESFETSVPWRNVLPLCRNVKDRLNRACASRGVKRPLVSCRVTQTYDTGVCVYFYFGFVYKGLSDPVHTYHEIEEEAREEVLANGGSLSHHHGVGKLRKKWLKETISESGVAMLKAVKDQIDPKNIFGSRNLV